MNSEVYTDASDFTTKAENGVVEVRTNACRGHCRCIAKCVSTGQRRASTLPTNSSKRERFIQLFLCPPHSIIASLAARVFTYIIIIGVVVTLLNADFSSALAWNTTVLAIIGLNASVCGTCLKYLKIPPLLGMLAVGYLFRNVPYLNHHFAQFLDSNISSALRNIALAIILLKGGYGLDLPALKKLSFVVIRLAFTPCIVECVTIATAAYLILQMPWLWGLMLGFVLAAVSPAVVVPSVLSLQQQGYGVDKGIPTLVVAAASIDDVLAITGFGVILGITFSTGDIAWNVFKGPLEALLGIVVGITWGVFLWYIPHGGNDNVTAYRSVLLVGSAVIFIFGFQIADLPGAGALAALTSATVSAYRWRSSSRSGHEVDRMLCYLWVVAEPLLFSLIGVEVDLLSIESDFIGRAFAVMFIGLGFRLVASYLVVHYAGLSRKEKAFVAIAWLPKATVQAAIGSVALDFVRRNRSENIQFLILGKQIVTIAVLSILVTAPLGAFAISFAGPHLLKKTTASHSIEERIPLDTRTVEQGVHHT